MGASFSTRLINQSRRDSPAILKGGIRETENGSHGPEGHCGGGYCRCSGPEGRQEEVMQNITDTANRADTPQRGPPEAPNTKGGSHGSLDLCCTRRHHGHLHSD